MKFRMFNNVHQQDYTIKWSNLTTKQNQLKLQKEGTITIMLITHAEKKKKFQMGNIGQNVKVNTTSW